MSMATIGDSLLSGIDTTPDDDSEDLSKLDRGDTLKDEGGEGDGDGDGEGAGAGGDGGGDGSQGKDGDGKDGDGQGDQEGEGDEGEGEEGEEDEEGEGDGEDDDDAGKGKPNPNDAARVSRAKRQRDEAVARAAALEQELAALRQQQAAKSKEKEGPTERETISTELENLYEQVEELRADGNTKEAAKIQRQIDEKNRRLGQLDTEETVQKREAQDAANRRYNTALDSMEAHFPQLKHGSDDYDQDEVNRVLRAIDRGVKAGLDPATAVIEAADLIYGVDITKAPKAKEAKAGKEAKGSKEAAEAKEKVVAARKTKNEAANKQPPNSSKHGADGGGDNTKIDVNRLSDEDFDKLPESVKAKMRGDFVS